jgi:hypothetical protein
MIKRSNLFSRDSFVFANKGETLAQIVLEPSDKVKIKTLVFTDAEAAKKLVEHVIRKYAAPFIAAVEESKTVKLLMSAGFRQCSCEMLWKIGDFDNTTPLHYRKFRSSDAEFAAALYNEELIMHFRPSLERSQQDFKGDNQYILESGIGKPISYLSIENNIIEFANSRVYDIPLDRIFAFAQADFVKLKKYTTNDFEPYLREHNFECVQTKIILVKDYYKPIKQTQSLFDFSFMRSLPSS